MRHASGSVQQHDLDLVWTLISVFDSNVRCLDE